MKSPGRERAGEFKESIEGKLASAQRKEGEMVRAGLHRTLLTCDSQLDL